MRGEVNVSVHLKCGISLSDFPGWTTEFPFSQVGPDRILNSKSIDSICGAPHIYYNIDFKGRTEEKTLFKRGSVEKRFKRVLAENLQKQKHQVVFIRM